MTALNDIERAIEIGDGGIERIARFDLVLLADVVSSKQGFRKSARPGDNTDLILGACRRSLGRLCGNSRTGNKKRHPTNANCACIQIKEILNRSCAMTTLFC